MRHTTIRPLIPAVTTLILAASLIPPMTATAAQTAGSPVSSVRSFPASTPRRNLLAESVSTTVDGQWGGIESLSIPKTQSPAEQAAKAAQASRSTRSSSRSAYRQPVTFDPGTLTGSGADVARYAIQFAGVPYRYAGTTPAGWDCSGFTSYVFRRFGVNLSHNSEAQRFAGTEVSADQAQPGDLMWKPGHVGIYLGNGLMVHASTPRTGTIIASAGYAHFRYYRINHQ